MGKSSPSLRDVARHAGVSLGTASRALNNKANVLPETRARVLKAASDLGYKLQMRVPTTISSKVNTIGVIMKRDPGKHLRIDPFNYSILCGIEAECERLGINMMYSSLPVDEYSRATAWSPMLDNDDIDGLVIVGVVFTDPQVTERIPENMPVVLVDSYAPHAEYDAVVIDNFKGAYRATTYLIERGHEHIGLIGSDSQAEEHPSILARRQGYLAALEDHNIPWPHVEKSHLTSASSYDATHRLLKRAPEITAIFACNDDIAQGIIEALQDENRRVPEEISVMGFDDTVVATRTQPPLTTIKVDNELMGAMAVRHLYEHAANLERPPLTTVIGTQLVERKSVRRVGLQVGTAT